MQSSIFQTFIFICFPTELERHLMTIKTLESVSSTQLTGEVMFSVGIQRKNWNQ